MKKIGLPLLLLTVVFFLGLSTEEAQAVNLDTAPPLVQSAAVVPSPAAQLPGEQGYICPSPTSLPDSIPELSLFTYQFDNPGGYWDFAAADVPGGLTIGPKGALSWTPTEMQGGWGAPQSSFTISIAVTDAVSISYCTYYILVTEVNNAIVGPPNGRVDLYIDENQPLSWTVPIQDYDPDRPVGPHTYSDGPNGTAMYPSTAMLSQTGVYTWNPTEYNAWCYYSCTQSYSIRLVITDGAYTLYMTVWIHVTETNSPPTISTIGDKTIPENAAYTFTFNYGDPDYYSQTLTVTLDGINNGASVSAADGVGTFSWTPTEAQGPGTYNFTIKVQDTYIVDSYDKSLSATMSFKINVNEVNTPPVIAPFGDKTIDEINNLSFTVTATDSDLPAQTPLVFSLIFGEPAAQGAQINASGLFSWLPTESQGPGSYPVTVKVCDSIGSTNGCSQASFKIQVNEVNLAPQIKSIPNKTIYEGQANTVPVSASDPDIPVQSLNYSLTGTVPQGTSIDPATGVISIFPTESMGGNSYTLTVQVCDHPTAGLCVNAPYSYNVTETYLAPILSVTPSSPFIVNEGAPINFTISASDPDIPPQPVELALSSQLTNPTLDPPSFNNATGNFAWVADEIRGPGDWSFTFTATDGYSTGNITVPVRVLEVNQNPVANAFPVGLSAKEGQPFTFDVKPYFSDPDLPAQTLYYQISSARPDQFTLAEATGLVTWTPTEAQGGQTISIAIHAMDYLSGVSSNSSLQVQVEEVNEPPVFTNAINDHVVAPGQGLTFNLAASDPDLPVQTLVYTLKRLDTGVLLLDNAPDYQVAWTAPMGMDQAVPFEAKVCDTLNLCTVKAFSVTTAPKPQTVFSTFLGLILK